MQMYKGLPIITNKILEHEKNGIPHHLLDLVDLRERPWDVQRFVKESSKIIDEIHARGRLPIVVGGTIYYTFSLLFEDALLSPTKPDNGGEAVTEADSVDDPILDASTEEIFAKLKEVDPDMAKKWHPNDRNKIRRSLEIYLKTGRKASEIYAEQRRPVDNSDDVAMASTGRKMNLRYPVLLLWLDAEDFVLKQRLDARVDAMVADGLCDEVVEMAAVEKELKSVGHVVDMTSGIWASIGYKELGTWLEAQQSGEDNKKIERAKREGIEAVKASTKRYAKRQVRFVRLRLAQALIAAGNLDVLLPLDCTDSTRWESTVEEPAARLVGTFMQGQQLPAPESLSSAAAAILKRFKEGAIPPDRSARKCEVCKKTLMTEKEWQAHLASRVHKNTVAASRRREAPIPSAHDPG
jgi:tRNA dimethylallyltransferase